MSGGHIGCGDVVMEVSLEVNKPLSDRTRVYGCITVFKGIFLMLYFLFKEISMLMWNEVLLT
jgi:hypothetical protein